MKTCVLSCRIANLQEAEVNELKQQVFLQENSIPAYDTSQKCLSKEDNKTDIAENITSDTDDMIAPTVPPPYPTSFKLVMQCIEKGVSIPGLEAIVVEPTNDSLTDCTLDLPKKPWEK